MRTPLSAGALRLGLLATLVILSFRPSIAQDSDGSWSTEFGGAVGFSGEITSLTFVDDELIVAGPFARVNKRYFYNFARWSGERWQPVQNEMQGGGRLVTTFNGQLYTIFSTVVDDLIQQKLARFSDGGWVLMGQHINGNVHALDSSADKIYIGGHIGLDGGQQTTTIAWWDGEAWQKPDESFDPGIISLLATDHGVYVGGSFTEVGELAVNGIAYWDGANWSEVGNGVPGEVWSIIEEDGTLYVGGRFWPGEESPPYGAARWDGNDWSVLGDWSSMSPNFGSVVRALAFFDGKIIAGGSIPESSGRHGYSLAYLDGEKWIGIEFNGSGVVKAMSVHNNHLYFVRHDRVYVWNGTEWRHLQDPNGGTDGPVDCILVVGTVVYIGGRFTSAGGHWVNGIARWDGSSWHSLGDGVNGSVYALAEKDGHIYVGGRFTLAGNVEAWNVAKWTGTEWEALDGGVTWDGDPRIAEVRSLTVAGDDVFAGGTFDKAGEQVAGSVARWDGERWWAVGEGFHDPSESGWGPRVFALLYDGHHLYAGGTIQYTGETHFTGGVAFWDGSIWQHAGIERVIIPHNGIYALQKVREKLYAAGRFINLEDAILAYDGDSWTVITPPYWPGLVLTLTTNGADLFAGGNFMTSHKNEDFWSVARWDGASWASMGNGVYKSVIEGEDWKHIGGVSAMAASGDKVFLGGDFDSTPAGYSNNIAVYTLPPTTTHANDEVPVSFKTSLGIPYPNPSRGEVLIPFEIGGEGRVRIDLHNVLGQRIRVLADETRTAGVGSFRADFSALPSGTYFIRLETDDASEAKAITVVK